MNTNADFDRHASAWLADGPTELSDRVLEAALREVQLTQQRRALRVPWRFPLMPALSRTTAMAALVLVAVVGAGTLFYLTSNRPGGVGSQSTSAPTTAPTAAPTVAPTAAPTPQPTFDPADPSAWTTYTSAVYGFTMAYPSDWSVDAPATHKWQPGEPAVPDAWPWADIFLNSEEVDGDSIGMAVWQAPAPARADLSTWEGLQAAFIDVCEGPSFGTCEFELINSVNYPTRMCLGQQECRPALIIPVGIEEAEPNGVFGDPETGLITVFQMGRPDDFPAAARYGGTIALLKAILAEVDVRPPQPDETPH
jgi:hypothetical protein